MWEDVDVRVAVRGQDPRSGVFVQEAGADGKRLGLAESVDGLVV